MTSTDPSVIFLGMLVASVRTKNVQSPITRTLSFLCKSEAGAHLRALLRHAVRSIRRRLRAVSLVATRRRVRRTDCLKAR